LAKGNGAVAMSVKQKELSPSSTSQLNTLVQAISQSQHRYRELIDNLDQAVFTLSPDGEVRVANRLLSELFSVGFPDLIGRRLDEFMAEPHLESVKRWLPELVARGSWSGTVPVRLKSESRTRQFACWFQPVLEEGRVASVIGWARDVTAQAESLIERHEIERRLQQEKEFVRRLIDSHPDVISVLDCEGRFIYASRRIKEVMGKDPGDYAGVHVGENVHPDDRARVVKHFADFVSGRSKESAVEFRASHGDDSWRTLRVTIGLMRDDSNKVTGVVASTSDITESRLAENQLAQNEKLTAMGQMLAGAAHELNNPLTAILGVADLLRERAADDLTRRHADLVLQQARRAAAIVQNLVSFSRPVSQGLSQIRLDEIVRNALDHQRASLSQQNIRIELDSAPNLPTVNGDPRLLAQVFENIITNAGQAISSVRSGGLLKISIQSANDFVRVSITDDGAGIQPENISKLFDPFFTTKRPGGGAGLGLTIGVAIIKEHGGRIEVASAPGAGATFDVFLPSAVNQGVRPATGASPAGSAAPSCANGLKGHTVLVVDDEESIREIVQQGLAARGMIVRDAASSEAALSLLESSPCEVVLCDFNLPGMSGEELFERLRAQRGSISPLFVFMTGELVDSEVVDRMREKGARVLQKPFAVSALTTLLTEILEPHPAGAK
jgi:PAS domain S-box-containing protein